MSDYNNEGQDNPTALQSGPYGGGSIEFFKILAAWRDEGLLKGLVFSS